MRRLQNHLAEHAIPNDGVHSEMNSRSMPSLPLSSLALVVANSVPLFGVLVWEWDLFTLVALYWLETLALAIFNVPKMAMARGVDNPEHVKISVGGTPAAEMARIPLIVFFLFHIGMFMAVHGVFVVVIFTDDLGEDLSDLLAHTGGLLAAHVTDHATRGRTDRIAAVHSATATTARAHHHHQGQHQYPRQANSSHRSLLAQPI